MALHLQGRPQRLVDFALETSTSEQCIAIVNDTTSANLRWANNTLTTNGVMHEIDVTVIAFQGAGNASVSGTAASPEQVRALVESADRAAAVADAAEDRAELVTGDAARDWSDSPGDTSIQVFEDFASAAGRGVQARRTPRSGSSTASCSTRSPRPTSAPRPGSGCAMSSRPGTTAARPRTPS